MGRRQTEWGVRARAALIQALGGKCEWCGEDDPNVLEIDHINGRDWVPSKVSSAHRVSIYRREAREGKVQVLCDHCNNSIGYRRRAQRRVTTN
jgi:hypothetical protein